MDLESASYIANIVMAIANILMVILGTVAVATYVQGLRSQRRTKRRFLSTLYRLAHDLDARRQLLTSAIPDSAAGAHVLASLDSMEQYLSSLAPRLDSLLDQVYELHPSAAPHIQAARFLLDAAHASITVGLRNPAIKSTAEIERFLDLIQAALRNGIQEIPGTEREIDSGLAPIQEFQLALEASERRAEHLKTTA